MKFILFVCLYILNLYSYQTMSYQTIQQNQKQNINLIIDNNVNSKQQKIKNIIKNDLKISNNFVITKEKQNIVLKMKIDESNNILQTQIWKNEQLYFEKKSDIKNIEELVLLIHKHIYLINNELNLPSIEWITKPIIYSKKIKLGVSDIIMTDYTFTYQKTIIKDDKYNVFPIFDNTNQIIFYTKYDYKPTLYKYDLKTNENIKLIESEGMIAATDLSKDKNKLLITITQKQGSMPNICLYNVITNKITDLSSSKKTNSKYINVNGRFGNTENNVLYVSNKFGSPRIISKNLLSNKEFVVHSQYQTTFDSINSKIVFDNKKQIYFKDLINGTTKKLSFNGKNVKPKIIDDKVYYIKTIGKKEYLSIYNFKNNKTFNFLIDNTNIKTFSI